MPPAGSRRHCYDPPCAVGCPLPLRWRGMRAEQRWTVYILRCGDGSLYTGITDRLSARLAAHGAGRGAKYTRSRLPVALAWARGRQTGTDARRLEAALKRATREAKMRLIAGDLRVWRELRRGLTP